MIQHDGRGCENIKLGTEQSGNVIGTLNSTCGAAPHGCASVKKNT